MITRWYRTGVFYSIDVGLFQDSNADGVGDFQGLVARLDYLARLGITTIWLHPIHPSPRRDGGYDITDYFGVHPRFGEMGDFEMLVHEAGERGIRVMLDLVVNHTSDHHPWFQSARSDPHSPYRDWYVWSETEPPDRFEGMVFPGVENETWTWDDVAHAWYRHRFYRFEPDLNTDNPAVREEIQKIAMFWLGLGVSGFRVDAAPFLIEPKTRPDGGPDYSFLHDLREALSWKKGDSVMLAEANVSDDELREYFGQADGTSTRVLMVFAFRLNQAIVLSLAREDRRPVAATLRELPDSRDSAKRDWYVWRDPAPDGGPPNNWRSAFRAVGPAWTFHEPTGQYYLHSFTTHQPDLNWDNPAVEAAMHDVLRFWLDRGADGFRIDVVYKLAKDPEFRDNEPDLRHDEDWPTIHDRLRRIRAVVEDYDGRVLVGEVYLLDLRRVVEYINTADELDLAHNFVFFHLPWRAAAFAASVQQFTDLAAAAAWPAWFLENHDHSRVATRYADALGNRQRRARVAAMMICALRGTPFLYYGQELGLPDAEIPPERVVDVDGRDPERAPMPWRPPSRAGPGAGPGRVLLRAARRPAVPGGVELQLRPGTAWAARRGRSPGGGGPGRALHRPRARPRPRRSTESRART